MAATLPYLPSNKNVPVLFEKIAAAKVADAFTTRFLAETLGLKGTNDRAMISLLKTLGFLEPGGKPSPEYGKLKNPTLARQAIAEAIRRAFAPLFASDEKANELDNDELKGLISQVAGTDASMTARIAATFAALVKAADFSRNGEERDGQEPERPALPTSATAEPMPTHGLNRAAAPAFHFNVQVHLPGNGTEETYLNIFNAIRKTFV